MIENEVSQSPKTKRQLHSTFWYTLNQLTEKIKIYVESLETKRDKIQGVKEHHK